MGLLQYKQCPYMLWCSYQVTFTCLAALTFNLSSTGQKVIMISFSLFLFIFFSLLHRFFLPLKGADSFLYGQTAKSSQFQHQALANIQGMYLGKNSREHNSCISKYWNMTCHYFWKQVFCTLLWVFSHSCLIIWLLLTTALLSSSAIEWQKL